MITHPFVKINLGLNVLRKREDGFHDIETLFLPYREISDTLEIIPADDYSRTAGMLAEKYSVEDGTLAQAVSDDAKVMITIARAEGVDWNPLEDLTVRACTLLARDFNLPSVKIFLEKTAPVGAGLGGGSSDAAFALMMIDEMFSLGLDSDAIASYAARLGSDCAFFVYGEPMFGEGRGEILSIYSLPDGFSENYEIKVIVPEGVSVSTADAYRGIRPAYPELSLKEALARPVEEWKSCLYNDFEKTVFDKYPALAKLKTSLYDAGAVYASMSGSGSAFYAIFRR